jgi:CHAT domain-containing protein/tetratricopeptide (TPR) repeat protein
VLVLLANRPASSAQRTDPFPVQCSGSASVEELLKSAEGLAARDQNTAARRCFERALSSAVDASDRTGESRARLGLATAAHHLADYQTAGSEATRAREMLEAAGDTYRAARADGLLGSIALAGGDEAAARALYYKSLAVFTALAADSDRASTLINIAYTHTGSSAERGGALDEALAIARKIGSVRLEARALHLRGDTSFNAGRYDEAIAALTDAAKKFAELESFDHLATVYVSLGRVYRAHGRADKAIEFYERAAEMQERTGDVRGLVQSINAKAVALGILKRAAESRAAYERALVLARTAGSERIINFQQGNLAAALADTGDLAGAIRLLEDVVTREKDPYVLAYRYGNLAAYYFQTERHETAAGHADRSIEYARQSANREYLVTLLQQRAIINRALGRLDEALVDARDGITVVEEIRAKLVAVDFMKRGFSERYQDIFGLNVALLHQRGETGQALVVSEQARARAFLDLLASRDLVRSSPASSPTAVVAPLPTRSLAVGRGPVAERGELALASDVAAPTASAVDIANTAARLRSTLLVYWVNDEEIFAWIARPQHVVEAARIPIKRAELEQLVEAAIPKPESADTAALQRLYTLLITPLAKWLPEAGSAMTIVPHGPLFRVSFAALQDASGDYLLERYDLGYGPSASAFALTDRMGARSRSQSAGRALVVADPRPLPIEPGRPPLPRLSAATREADAIRRSVGREQTTVLTGRQAQEPAVRDAIVDRRVVHFATHAVIQDDEPLESYLALGGSGESSAVDGRLTVRELYDLSLSADLVVLSACRTATGRPSGDGISGMARALFYAGTPTVVATLWDVADQPSATMISGFYSHLAGDGDKRRALRRAQLDLLRQLRSGSMLAPTPRGNVRLDARPFYWAGYVLIGEPF